MICIISNLMNRSHYKVSYVISHHQPYHHFQVNFLCLFDKIEINMFLSMYTYIYYYFDCKVFGMDQSVERLDSSNPPTVSEPKIKLSLNNIKVVATWNYNVESQDCKLCHRDLMVPVQEAGSNKLNGDVVIGNCRHGFHTVCINSWLMKKNVSCPHCLSPWKPTMNVGSSVYMYKSTV